MNVPKILRWVLAIFMLFISEINFADIGDQQSEFRNEVANRVLRLADYLDNSAKEDAEFGKTIPALTTRQVSNDFAKKIGNGSIIAYSARPYLDKLNRAPTIAERADAKIEFTQKITTTAVALSDYAGYLRDFHDKIANAPPDQILGMLQDAYVPREVAIMVSPFQEKESEATSGQSVNAGSTSAHALGVGGLVPFIVTVWPGDTAAGAATIDYPSTGAILYAQGKTSVIRCTGTLVAPNAVLTAKHCKTLANPSKVYFQHAGVYDIDQKKTDAPENNSNTDAALIFLKSNVTGINFAKINDIEKISINTTGVIVGFGFHSNNLKLIGVDTDGNASATPTSLEEIQQAGMKLHANITTGTCPQDEMGQPYICWTYVPGAPNQSMGSTCDGDSGGPLVINIKGQLRVAGITSGGQSCSPNAIASDIDVYSVSGWLKDRLKANPPDKDSNPWINSPLNAMNNDGARYIVADSGMIFNANATPYHQTFNIPPNVKALRVAVNATPTPQNMSLEVSQSGATGACTSSAPENVLECEVKAPAPGKWQLKLTGYSFQEFQIVATVF
jgi:hypothetical protein